MKNKVSFAVVMKSISVLVLIGMLVAGFALVFPADVVLAAGMAQDDTPPTAEPQVNTARLERLYQRQVRLLEKQEERLAGSDERVARAEERIAGLKEDGLDTTPLEEALAEFEDQVAEAEAVHQEAADILSAYAGFDADGKVTDAEQARDTVKESGRAIKDAHRILRAAVRDLTRAIRQFIRDNK